MSEITIYKKNYQKTKLPNGLTLSELPENVIPKSDRKVIIAAYGSEKIKNLDKQDSGVIIRQLINKAIFTTGYGASWDDRDINMLITEVISDIYREFPFLTLAEVSIAFANGAREMYGDVRGLSVRIFYRWLKAYCSTTKLKAHKKLQMLPKQKSEGVTPEKAKEIHEKWLNGVLQDYDKYCETGVYNITDFNNHLYEYLNKLGLIKISKQQKKKIYQKVYQEEKVNPENRGVGAIIHKNKTFENRVKSKCKDVVLYRMFEKWRKGKKNLRKLIENAQAKLKT